MERAPAFRVGGSGIKGAQTVGKNCDRVMAKSRAGGTLSSPRAY